MHLEPSKTSAAYPPKTGAAGGPAKLITPCPNPQARESGESTFYNSCRFIWRQKCKLDYHAVKQPESFLLPGQMTFRWVKKDRGRGIRLRLRSLKPARIEDDLGR
jgi:hypothetical protein